MKKTDCAGKKLAALLVVLAIVATTGIIVGRNVKAATYTYWQGATSAGVPTCLDSPDGTSPNGGMIWAYNYLRPDEATSDTVGAGGASTVANAWVINGADWGTDWNYNDRIIFVVNKLNTVTGAGYMTVFNGTLGYSSDNCVLDHTIKKIPGGTDITFTASDISWPAIGVQTSVDITDGAGNPMNYTGAGLANVYGYRVYESTAEGGPYSVVGDTTTTTLSLAPTVGNWYKISVLCRSATTPVESNYTGLPRQYTTTAPDTTAPAAPTGLTATPGNAVVDLSWNANTESDLAGYNVYRSETSGYVKINTALVTGTSYHDTGLTNGVTYYYVATAEDNATIPNESPYSNEVSAVPKKPAEGGKHGFIPSVGMIGTSLALLAAALIIYKRRRK